MELGDSGESVEVLGVVGAGSDGRVAESDTGGCEVAQMLVGDGHVVDVEKEGAPYGMSVNRTGMIEGQSVHDIVLDTGCTWTMMRQDILPYDFQTTGQTVQI